MDRKDIIIEEICKFYGIEKKMISNKSRVKPLPLIRQTIAYFLRQKTMLSLMKCAEAIHYDNHASVCYAVNEVKNGMKYYSDYANEIKQLNLKIDVVIGLNESYEPILIEKTNNYNVYLHKFKGLLQ
ncbi:helix-turn-helix domain-containing protein [Massilibacteroides sp.]|uniref:helix-turn-helix domain-containing protein n=1 Tax=Massilibacteroides sp. TaxID=2034766 RepID=UPI00260AB528|nr:helix-turn-helix domain-containing protein [Massilibacteroides sp.]MDD4515678.1 helix-turn-helix domain-containing protein [Massilibacteroides sp.]